LIQGKEISYNILYATNYELYVEFCQLLLNHNLVIKQRDDINEQRKHYKEHGDIDKALRNFPRHLVAERAIVSLYNIFTCPGINWNSFAVWACTDSFLMFHCLHVSSFSVWRNALVTIYRHLRVSQEHWEWCMLHPLL